MARRKWIDRVVEYPRRYTMQDNGDGTVTLTPAPGEILAPGTPVNAANLNGLEEDLESHLADNVYDKEIHGIRVHGGELQVYNTDELEWKKYNELGDDKTNSPGSKNLIAGTMDAGYFGVVPASDLFTGTELAGLCEMVEGIPQFSDIGWLKFAIDGKIIFKSQKPIRHKLKWNDLDIKGCVFGTKEVSKNGNRYKVRLMKGALTDPSMDAGTDKGAKGSEWNRLMLPISIKAKDKSWSYPNYVETTVPYWGIDFTDVDLHVINSAGDGSYQYCQETIGSVSTSCVVRGGLGVSGVNTGVKSPSVASVNYGWSPVLEYI